MIYRHTHRRRPQVFTPNFPDRCNPSSPRPSVFPPFCLSLHLSAAPGPQRGSLCYFPTPLFPNSFSLGCFLAGVHTDLQTRPRATPAPCVASRLMPPPLPFAVIFFGVPGTPFPPLLAFRAMPCPSPQGYRFRPFAAGGVGVGDDVRGIKPPSRDRERGRGGGEAPSPGIHRCPTAASRHPARPRGVPGSPRAGPISSQGRSRRTCVGRRGHTGKKTKKKKKEKRWF